MISRLSFILLLLVSCNPVKQVLSDKSKLDKVAKEVVKMGYCANDTTIITKSDTLVEIDTLTIIDEKPFLEVINDTVYVTKWKTNNITKSVTIHDTIKSVVVDKALVNLLKEDIDEWKVKFYKERHTSITRFFWIVALLLLIVMGEILRLKRYI